MHLGSQSLALAKDGRIGEALEIAQRLERMDDDIRGIWYGRLSSRLVRGDTSGALSALEAAAAGDGDLVLSIIPANPRSDAIRATPHACAAMRRYQPEDAPLVPRRAGRDR